MAQELKSKIAIVGGGPAGCICAYFLQNKFDVTVFDKRSPLRTLLPTGGGRCNLAHAEYDFRELAKNYPRGEKFLYSVIKENTNLALRRIINDKYFIVSSLNDIVAEYNKGTLEGATDNNKNFYGVLIKHLASIGTSEDIFVTGLCDDIINNVDFTKFVNALKQVFEK